MLANFGYVAGLVISTFVIAFKLPWETTIKFCESWICSWKRQAAPKQHVIKRWSSETASLQFAVLAVRAAGSYEPSGSLASVLAHAFLGIKLSIRSSPKSRRDLPKAPAALHLKHFESWVIIILHFETKYTSHGHRRIQAKGVTQYR